MRRYLEAGLLENDWTELQHRAVLRGGGRLREAAGDMISAFSVSHIMPAFVVLLVGTVLSSAVFIGELIVNCLYKGKEEKQFSLEESESVVLVLYLCCISVFANITDVD
jgi:hypothetical protein